jgi:hypothetical protein
VAAARIRTGLAAAAALALSCAAPAWRAADLEARYPALAAVEGHRLGDVRPYYLPMAGQLTLFLCRWPDAAVVPVALPGDATAEERAALEAALAGWEALGLGVRFERVRRLEGAGVEIELVEGMLPAGANTVADCAVDASDPTALSTDPLPARIALASIQLARGDPRLAGAAMHELGHALGFQGHPSRGDTVMRTGTRAARETTERLARAEVRRDAALAALYAVPSGTVLARLPLPAGHTDPVDRLQARARREGWIGPLLRAGSTEGRVAWLDRRGRPIALGLTGLAAALRDPRRLQIDTSRIELLNFPRGK